jgi:hypothetical protein
MRTEQVFRKQLRRGQLLSEKMCREHVVIKQWRSGQLLTEQMCREQVFRNSYTVDNCSLGYNDFDFFYRKLKVRTH